MVDVDWSAEIEGWAFPDHLRVDLSNYAKKLESHGFPVIFELSHLAHYLSVDAKFIADCVNRTEAQYRSFSIPKRSGGTREISVPSPSLLAVQRWILDNILSKIVLHPCAYGFVEGRGIIENARQHVGAKCLLKLDLKDFFPSISLRRIFSVFRNAGYSLKVSYFLARLCTLNFKLPQGASTSPYLSNIVAKRLDRRLQGLCSRHGFIYTRYADDIAISGAAIDWSLVHFISFIVADEGFILNQSKSILIKEGAKKIVTGLVVGNDRVSVPRKFKRQLRQRIFYMRKFGLDNHMLKTNDYDPMYLDKVRGQLAFLKFVEPTSRLVMNGLEALKIAEASMDSV